MSLADALEEAQQKVAQLLHQPEDLQTTLLTSSPSTTRFILQQWLTPEIVVQSAFEDVVINIGVSLGIHVARAYSSPFVVGALFAHPTYDVRGQKSCRLSSLQIMAPWFSRDLNALHFISHSVSHYTLSQKCFKVFVENDSRDAIFTWPFVSGNSYQNDEPYSRDRVARSYTLQVMTSVIMQVITICLLACGEDDLISSLNPMAVEATPLKSIQASSTDAFTCEKEQGRKRKREDASSKKQARSGSVRKRIPQFISGYIDGQPIYTKVRVMDELQVEELERLSAE
ncbi:hypothetical protein MIR68_008068 [Amoeboaphelidium protococcarum]|nr:hypothetical protein MIR68_008068 [Amoeboaphelidium protococcarum]